MAHFSGVLVLLCVACVKQGLNLDRKTLCYVAKELTFQTDCVYGWRVLHGVIAEDFGRHGDPSPEGHLGLIFAEACDAKIETCIWASKCLHHAG